MEPRLNTVFWQKYDCRRVHYRKIIDYRASTWEFWFEYAPALRFLCLHRLHCSSKSFDVDFRHSDGYIGYFKAARPRYFDGFCCACAEITIVSFSGRKPDVLRRFNVAFLCSCAKLAEFHFYSARNARIASAVLATAIPSVCQSVTRRYCVKTTASSTVQFVPLDSKMCLVL